MQHTVPKPRLTVDLQTLADFGVQCTYRKEVIIVKEGEMGDSLFILIQGRACVYTTDARGKVLNLDTLVSGDYFGEMSLDGGARSATVEALEPCLCIIVPNKHVLAFARKNSDFAISLLQTTITRARASKQAISNKALLEV